MFGLRCARSTEILAPIILVSLALGMAFVSSAGATSWSGSVETQSDSWYIYRESGNLSFTMVQHVDGTVSPSEHRGRVLAPFTSYYADIDVDDIRLKDRTAALEGRYFSEEEMTLKSTAKTAKSAGMNVTKPAGTNVYMIDFYEIWPVCLNYSRVIDYSGRGINDREFAGNNYDFVGMNTLYNREYSKSLTLSSRLERMNATIFATDEAIEYAEVMANRDLDVRLETHTTGIADISYRQVSSEYVPKGSSTAYEVKNEGDERFVGDYDIMKHFYMSSEYNRYRTPESWLPCCYGGWDGMSRYDQKGHSAQGIFDCTCYVPPSRIGA